MKLAHIFVITFLWIFSCTQPQSTNSISLVQNICDIQNDLMNSNSDTKDILIGSLNDITRSTIVNDIIECIGDSSPVVVTDFKTRITAKNLRKASLVILLLETSDMNKFKTLISIHRKSTPWHHMAKIIFIIPNTWTLSERVLILKIFHVNGFLNVAVVYITSSSDVIYENIKDLSAGYLQKNVDPIDSQLVFPDKLKDFNGYTYQIAEIDNTGWSFITKQMNHFLYMLKSIQNSNFKILKLPDTNALGDYWNRRKIHLSINIATVHYSIEPKLMTYEEKSYCALVPIPEKASFFLMIIIKPFDRFLWTLIALAVVCSVAVWRLFRNRGAVDSHWNVAALWLMVFIGQGLDFSRRNRTVLLILVHLISVSVFILSNLYESFVTSFTIDPVDEHLKTVKNLLASSYVILADKAFTFSFENTNEFMSRINTSTIMMTDNDGEFIIQKRFVFIRTCDQAENALRFPLYNGKLYSDYYYILPERITGQFIHLEASYNNPFLERFQYYMDLSFEAGLPKMWKTFDFLDHPHEMKNEESSEFLMLEDLLLVFGILAVGCAVAGFVLLMEIYFHDFIRNLDWTRLCRCIKSWFIKLFCKFHRPKVRRIYVRPRV